MGYDVPEGLIHFNVAVSVLFSRILPLQQWPVCFLFNVLGLRLLVTHDWWIALPVVTACFGDAFRFRLDL